MKVECTHYPIEPSKDIRYPFLARHVNFESNDYFLILGPGKDMTCYAGVRLNNVAHPRDAYANIYDRKLIRALPAGFKLTLEQE